MAIEDIQLQPTRVGDHIMDIAGDFGMPKRQWEVLIDTYNHKSKRKFPFTPLQCNAILEWVKRGVHTPTIFKSIGFTSSRYARMTTMALDMDERLELLSTKDNLTNDEFEEFQTLSRNPYRILVNDIQRAEGISEMLDWDMFNHAAYKQSEILLAKMKAKFKDVFSEKNETATSLNVQINVGGDWANEL